MDSSVLPKDEIWFLRVCHYISTGLYLYTLLHCIITLKPVTFIFKAVRISYIRRYFSILPVSVKIEILTCFLVLQNPLFREVECHGFELSEAQLLDCVWNVMAHGQKPDFVFRRNGRVHLNRQGRQFSRLLAAEVCASAVVMVVMMDTPCSEAVWRVLTTHSNRQFSLHFPSRTSPYAITFQLDSTTVWELCLN